MTRLIFVSYASGHYKKNIFWNKLFVRLFIRPDVLCYYTDKDLKSAEIYGENKAVFDHEIGAGLWAWKPWVILKGFGLANTGDIVIYQDCGFGLRYKNLIRPKSLIEYAKFNGSMPGVYVPKYGKNRKWTVQRCFDEMGCNSTAYYETSQVEAVISLWEVNTENRAIISEWQEYCLNSRAIMPALEEEHHTQQELISHRYDQSILTNLVVKYKMKPLDSDTPYASFSKSLTLTNLSIMNSRGITWVISKCILLGGVFYRRLKKSLK